MGSPRISINFIEATLGNSTVFRLSVTFTGSGLSYYYYYYYYYYCVVEGKRVERGILHIWETQTIPTL
jgi:hypothetical protein